MASLSNFYAAKGQKSCTDRTELTLSECMCPICRCILIEPVTMPCKHELCMPCFQKNVQQASLCCPLCRKRISTWARRAAKLKNLVDENRWDAIKTAFPDKVQSRIDGREDEDDSDEDDDYFFIPHIAAPGEIRQEYEKERQKLEQEREQSRLEEEAASRELIRRLQEEEEARRREQELLIEQDEELVRRLMANDGQAPLTVNPQGTPKATMLDRFVTRGRSSPSTSSSLSPSTMNSAPSASKTKHGHARKTTTRNGSSPDLTKRSSAQKNRNDAEFWAARTHLSMYGYGAKDHAHSQRSSFSGSPLRSREERSPIVIDDSSSSVSVCRSESGRSVESVNSGHRRCRSGASSMSSGGPLVSALLSEDLKVSPELGSSCSLSASAKSRRVDGCAVSKTKAGKNGDVKRKDSGEMGPEVSREAEGSLCKGGSEREDGVASGSGTEGRPASTDSLGPEMCHFKPIHCSPRTPPRLLVDGRYVDPPVIRSTPRHPSQAHARDPGGGGGGGGGGEGGSGSGEEEAGIPDASPVMRRRLSQLAAERKEKVAALSKSTGPDLPLLPTLPTTTDHSYSSPDEGKRPSPDENSAPRPSKVVQSLRFDVDEPCSPQEVDSSRCTTSDTDSPSSALDTWLKQFRRGQQRKSHAGKVEEQSAAGTEPPTAGDGDKPSPKTGSPLLDGHTVESGNAPVGCSPVGLREEEPEEEVGARSERTLEEEEKEEEEEEEEGSMKKTSAESQTEEKTPSVASPSKSVIGTLQKCWEETVATPLRSCAQSTTERETGAAVDSAADSCTTTQQVDQLTRCMASTSNIIRSCDSSISDSDSAPRTPRKSAKSRTVCSKSKKRPNRVQQKSSRGDSVDTGITSNSKQKKKEHCEGEKVVTPSKKVVQEKQLTPTRRSVRKQAGTLKETADASSAECKTQDGRKKKRVTGSCLRGETKGEQSKEDDPTENISTTTRPGLKRVRSTEDKENEKMLEEVSPPALKRQCAGSKEHTGSGSKEKFSSPKKSTEPHFAIEYSPDVHGKRLKTQPKPTKSSQTRSKAGTKSTKQAKLCFVSSPEASAVDTASKLIFTTATVTQGKGKKVSKASPGKAAASKRRRSPQKAAPQQKARKPKEEEARPAEEAVEEEEEEEPIFSAPKVLDRSHFISEEEYRNHLEEQDRLLAMQLQADFDLEVKLRLSAIRRKGSAGQYELRRKNEEKGKTSSSSAHS